MTTSYILTGYLGDSKYIARSIFVVCKYIDTYCRVFICRYRVVVCFCIVSYFIFKDDIAVKNHIVEVGITKTRKVLYMDIHTAICTLFEDKVIFSVIVPLRIVMINRMRYR